MTHHDLISIKLQSSFKNFRLLLSESLNGLDFLTTFLLFQFNPTPPTKRCRDSPQVVYTFHGARNHLHGMEEKCPPLLIHLLCSKFI